MDMFLNLSDPLLFIIISFLPFKEAAKTSVLSRRWRHLWLSTKNIDFNEHFFVGNDIYAADREIQRQVFIEFVQHWIANYQEPTIDKFSLTFSQPRNLQLVVMQNCIAFSLARNVKHLGLDFSDPTWNSDDLGSNHPGSFDLPSDLYNHRVLESLTLFSCNFNVSIFTNFRLLKNVSLGWIELPSSTLNSLLESCGLLESLSLKKCWNIDNYLEVCGRDLNLRTLVLDRCMFLSPYFLIEAPNLRFFKYVGSVGTFDVNITSGLEEVDLDFGLEPHFDGDNANLLYRLLYEVFPLRALTVSTYMLQVITMGEEPIVMRPNLIVTHLTLKTAMRNQEQFGIMFFLNSCPGLETLTIDIRPCATNFLHEYQSTPFDELNPYDTWMRNAVVYLCITQTLRVVHVTGFKGKPNQVYFLAYLILYGRVMEELTIVTSLEVSNNEDVSAYQLVAQQLLTLRRASRNLQITIF